MSIVGLTRCYKTTFLTFIIVMPKFIVLLSWPFWEFTRLI